MGASDLDWVGIKKSRIEISLSALSRQLGCSLLTGQTILPASWCSLEISVFFLNRYSHAKDAVQKLHNALLPC